MIRFKARYMHMTEAITNVVIGYLINLILVQVILQLLGFDITLSQNATMGFFIALVSFVRGYTIRRLFNNVIKKMYAEELPDGQAQT